MKKLVVLFALFAVGCGYHAPDVVHAQQSGNAFRLYSDHTPCGTFCSPSSPGYWLIDRGHGTPVQFFESVTIKATATAQQDSFVMVFDNAILTVNFCNQGSVCNTATLTDAN